MIKLPSAKEELARMNDDHVVVKTGGKVRIAGWETQDVGSGRKVKAITFSSPAEMKTLYANRFILVKGKDANGETVNKRRPLLDYWLQHADRPTAIGFTIDPAGGLFVEGRLNLWQGFSVVPKEGDWSRLRKHILDVICSGNNDHAAYLLRYLAYKFQNPTTQSEVIIVLRGKQGTGKGRLATLLCELFGAHGLQISDRRHLVGNFNAHLLQTCFLFADEAFWAGDKQAEGTLKRMATEPTLMYEPKGLDAFSGPNRLTVMMASNEKWVVPAAEDDRRFVVFDVSDVHQRDSAYFAALGKELDSGGREAFLHAMLTKDLQGWHPREDMPVTQALAEQKAESAEPLVEWLGNILEEGMLPAKVYDSAVGYRDIVHNNNPALARADPLRLHAVSRAKHLKGMAFWKFLDEHGIKKAEDERQSAGRFRRFPPLSEARALFREKHPWWPGFDNPHQDWQFAPEHDPWNSLIGKTDQEEEPLEQGLSGHKGHQFA
jgi:hypothetical protein